MAAESEAESESDVDVNGMSRKVCLAAAAAFGSKWAGGVDLSEIILRRFWGLHF